MAVTGVNTSRVTQNLRTSVVIESLRQNQLDLFRAQNRISSGRSFVNPSDDPILASRSLTLERGLKQQEQFERDIELADSVLTATDSTIAEITGLLSEASTIASQNVSNLTSAEERLAESELVAGIREQLMIVGNRQFNGRYIFAGRDTERRPFVDALGGVAYLGDTGDLVTRFDAGLTTTINVPGNQLFGALSSTIASSADLTPALTEEARLDDLNGATGDGIRAGQLIFNEQGGAGVFTVDLTTADTVGDVVALINVAASDAGAGVTASIGESGLTITPGPAPVSISDTSTGVIAADLGILTEDATTGPIVGRDLGVRLSRVTPVEALARGAGIDLESGLTITNGPESVTVDFSDARTVQDIINKLNNAGVFILARINESGTGIDLFNQVSGVSLSVGENGGTTAADLGVRTFDRDTPLERLNFGRGVVRIEGKGDLLITAKDGNSFEVNLDNAVTIGDVIDLINAAASDAGVSVNASLAADGNGIRLTDQTGGTGDLSVGRANGSQAADDLGLLKTTGDQEAELIGDDTNPTRTEGFLDALVQLEEALRGDDTQGITLAAERLDQLAQDVIRTHGVVGARAQSAQAKLQQVREAVDTSRLLLSEVEDLDFAEAITRLQSAQIALQADLQTSTQLLSLSLLDFLE
jgi:flagellar hook-associated protein 3